MISARLSLVNMIQDVAEKIGHMNVDTVTNAFKAANIRITGKGYYKAGMGDGGACHPRDNIALSWLANELDLGYDLFHAIAHSREKQTENMANFVAEICKEKNLPCVINGKAYKPGVPYTVGSPSLLLAHYLEKQGIKVYYADPNTGDIPTWLGDPVEAVCFLAHDANVTYQHTGRTYDKELYFNLKEGSVIIDPWRNFKSSKYEIIYYGK